MAITSLAFALFVAATLAAFYLLPRRGQLGLLLAASYAFCATFSWPFVPVLALLTAVNYLLGRALWKRGGRALLWTGIGVNVLSLALLKYREMYLPGMIHLLGLDEADIAVASVLLPIGLSYRVLENISFLVDASRRQLDGFPRPLDFALYTAWFPKLLSGPIERARGFFAELARPRVIDNAAVGRGLTLVAIGLLRKLVIADSLRRLIPPQVLEAPFSPPGWHLVFWLLVDVFIVYNDFAGYTDIVRGVSIFFGIDLQRNFSAPFFARNFSEFWLRWHTSLSTWLRDYVFTPLSRGLLRRSVSPNALANLVVPPLAAMLVSALWHQASWHVLAWGVLWGIFLFLGRLPLLWRPVVPADRQPPWRQALGALGVVGMLVASNLLFRFELSDAGVFLGRTLGIGRFPPAVFTVLLLLVLSLAVDWAQHRWRDEIVFLRWPVWARSLALATVVAAAFVLTRAAAPPPFIYQGF